MEDGKYYGRYENYCRSVGIEPARLEVWAHEVSSINAEASGFNRHGKDLLLHSAKKLHKAFVTIGCHSELILGQRDTAAMQAIIDRLISGGKIKPSYVRSRVIDGETFTLYEVTAIARLVGKLLDAEPEPDNEQPIVEPELTEFLVSNAVLDTYPAPATVAA